MSKKSVGGRVLLIFAVIFLVLTLVAFVLYSSMTLEFIDGVLNRGEGGTAGEQLGEGLSVAFALIFMIIFGVADLILATVALAFSFGVLKLGYRKVGIVFIILLAAIIAITVISFVVALVINANATEETAFLLYSLTA